MGKASSSTSAKYRKEQVRVWSLRRKKKHLLARDTGGKAAEETHDHTREVRPDGSLA